MKKIYSKLIQKALIIVVLFLSTFHLQAQVAWDSFYADNVQVCLQSEKAVVQVSLGTSTTGSYLEAKLPAGFDFAGFNAAASSNTNGTIAYGGEVAGWHRFDLTFTSTAASTVKVVFDQFGTCAAGISSFTTQDSFRFNNTFTTVNQAGLAFNGTAPDLSITSVTNSPSPAPLGATITRKFTVTNGGFGASSNFTIADHYTPGEMIFTAGTFVINPAGANFTIPAGQISIGTDTVKINLTATQIQQIGDLDTLFENGESFELEYDFVPQVCGNSNVVISELLATWKCPDASSCNWFTVSTGASIAIPPTPVLTRLASRSRPGDCYNNSTVGDTIVITNSGAGAARNLTFTINSRGFPNGFRAEYMGSLDTANFKYSIGENGTETKPVMTVTGTKSNSYSSWGCSQGGLPGRVVLTIPLLEAGDTLFIKASMLYCSIDAPCSSNPGGIETVSFAGLDYSYEFQNACENLSFSGGSNFSVYSHITPRVALANFAPNAVQDGVSYDFIQKITSTNVEISLAQPGRTQSEIKINLPSVLTFDSAFADRVYFETAGGTIILPYAQTGPYTFRFRNHVGLTNGKLHILVKGFCDPVTLPCPSLYNWGYEWRVNPDTTVCSYYNQFVCKDFQVAWTSTCRPMCCPEGLQSLEYSSNRINYGQPDNDDNKLPDATGSIDLTRIQTNQIIPGDTVEYYFKGVVNTSAAHPSWPFAKLIFDVSNSSYWTLVSDSVFVKRAVLGDTSFAITPTVVGSQFYHTDISFMPDFQQNDTIIVKMKLRNTRNDDWSFTNQWDGWVSDVAAQPAVPTNLVNVWRCTPIGDVILGWRRLTQIDNSRSTTLNSLGCNVIRNQVAWIIETGFLGRGSADKFDFEYRPAGYPTQYIQYIPEGYTVDSVKFDAHTTYTAAGTSTGTTVYNGDLIPFTVANDTLKFNMGQFYTPNGGLLPPTDEGATINASIYLTPSCKTTNNVAEVASAQHQFTALSTPFNVFHRYGTTSRNNQTTYRNQQPEFITNSPVPIAPAYERTVSWDVTHTNATAILANNSWMYFVNNSGNVTVDSVQVAGVTGAPDANGFYQLGDIAGSASVNLKIFSTQNACQFDSILAYVGYGCSGYPTMFTDSTCSSNPIPLFVQPQPAAIQTQISALSATPVDPANPGAGTYGSSTVTMCESFPMEMEIQSTQTGNIYNVVEQINLPSNFGNVGLDYVPDSGYIEYPIGTAPRKFGWRGDSAILATVASGQMLLAMDLIDSLSFDSLRGQLGTGLGNNTTRRAIVRWKMKPNCNMVSGDQWTATQFANSPCGDTAAGNKTLTSGFPLNLTGVSRPYVASVAVASSPDACGPFTTSISIQKIGTNASLPNDSVFIRLPLTVTNGNVACQGVNCPAAAVPYSEETYATYRIIKFPFPSGLTTGDTLRYEFPTQSKEKGGCETGQEIKCDVFQRVTVLCSGVACPNAVQSLGTGNVLFDLEKPELSFTNYEAIDLQFPSPYKYVYQGTIENTSGVDANAGMVLKTYFDKNGNGMYDADPIDSFIKDVVIPTAIAAGSSYSFMDSFTSTTTAPNPNRPLYSVIDTGDAAANCFCAGVAPSMFLNALPVELLSFDATKVTEGEALVSWTTSSEYNASHFEVYRSTDGANFMEIGRVKATGNSTILQRYSVMDDISSVNGKVYYKLKQVDDNGTSSWSDVVTLSKNGLSSTFQVSPNPTKGNVTVRFDGSKEGIQLVKVYNAKGELVYSQNAEVKEANLTHQIALPNLPIGVYGVVIGEESIKLVISK